MLSESTIPKNGPITKYEQSIVTPAPSSLPGEFQGLQPSHQTQKSTLESGLAVVTNSSIHISGKESLVRLGILYIGNGEEGIDPPDHIVRHDPHQVSDA